MRIGSMLAWSFVTICRLKVYNTVSIVTLATCQRSHVGSAKGFARPHCTAAAILAMHCDSLGMLLSSVQDCYTSGTLICTHCPFFHAIP
jgi:hypothetical protein